MYKNNWEEIVDNCASLIYLVGDYPKTLEFLSKRLGEQTIGLMSNGKSKCQVNCGKKKKNPLDKAFH